MIVLQVFKDYVRITLHIKRKAEKEKKSFNGGLVESTPHNATRYKWNAINNFSSHSAILTAYLKQK